MNGGGSFLGWPVRLGILAAVFVGCSFGASSPTAPASPPAPDSSTAAAPPGLEALIGEVFVDPAWPSEHRDTCITANDGAGHVELVAEDRWSVDVQGETGWFSIVDSAGRVLFREHHLAAVWGEYLDAPGCREGRLFQVEYIEPFPNLDPSENVVLHVETVNGGGSVSVEGSITVVRVVQGDRPVIQQPVPPGGQVVMPPGIARVIAYQKACDGNCMTAYGFELPCELSIEASRGDELTLSVILEEHRCTPSLRPGPSSDGASP